MQGRHQGKQKSMRQWHVTNMPAQHAVLDGSGRIATLKVLITQAQPTLLSILSRWWKTAGSSSHGLYRSRRYVRLQQYMSNTQSGCSGT
jgi:hypothetical protein